jgi:hypothetical protein
MDEVLVPFYEERETIVDEVSRLKGLAAEGGSDFLVATSSSDQIWNIAKTASEIPSGAFAWIGEHDGHERFRTELEKTTKFRIEEKMERAMSDVIDSGAVPSVGGLVVRVSTKRYGLLSYFPVSGFHIGDGDPGGLAPGQLTAVSLSNSPYHWRALQSADDYPAVGWWHSQSRVGLVSTPLTGTASRIFEAETEAEAAVEAEKLTGYRMLHGQVFRGRIVFGLG